MIKELMFKPKGKKGELLIENIVFMILNLAFLSILVLFLMKQGGSGALYEEAYSKQIALLLDSAKPGMVMTLNFEKGMELAKDKGVLFNNTVIIDNDANKVYVKLSDSGGKEYHFFNEVQAYAFPDKADGQYNGMYIITVDNK
jgi:hypothetical protein